MRLCAQIRRADQASCPSYSSLVQECPEVERLWKRLQEFDGENLKNANRFDFVDLRKFAELAQEALEERRPHWYVMERGATGKLEPLLAETAINLALTLPFNGGRLHEHDQDKYYLSFCQVINPTQRLEKFCNQPRLQKPSYNIQQQRRRISASPKVS
eukprot:GHVT01054709.1.p1 GENE.GHVT01054709.1~~GHVT01054709.1.p1  ORF type:complete len:158 (+),score=17.50 GHVT01054709.1:962-1435(+)